MPLEPISLLASWPALGTTVRIEFVDAGPATASLTARLSRPLARDERLVAWTRFGGGKWHDVETSWDAGLGRFVAALHFSSCVDAVWTFAIRYGRLGREAVWLGPPDVNARFALVAVTSSPRASPSLVSQRAAQGRDVKLTLAGWPVETSNGADLSAGKSIRAPNGDARDVKTPTIDATTPLRSSEYDAASPAPTLVRASAASTSSMPSSANAQASAASIAVDLGRLDSAPLPSTPPEGSSPSLLLPTFRITMEGQVRRMCTKRF